MSTPDNARRTFNALGRWCWLCGAELNADERSANRTLCIGPHRRHVESPTPSTLTQATLHQHGLYADLTAAGIPTASHESDLYFPDTEQACAILARYPTEQSNARRFTNQAPPHKGERWLDVPFAYLPWWKAHTRSGVPSTPATPQP